MPPVDPTDALDIMETFTRVNTPCSSALEKLPTELLQQIAAYLIREDHALEYNELDPWDNQRMESNGLCEL